MKRNLLVLSVLSVLFAVTLRAQQNKMLTHFFYDKMSVNPGSSGVGMDDGFCGTAIYRNQWDRVNGAPTSAILNVEGTLSRKFPGGFGLSFYHDAIGFARQNNVNLNYSYHLNIGDGVLGIGAAAGLVSYGMQPDWVTPDPGQVGAGDNSLPQGLTEANLDINAGLYYQHYSGWYAGVSATHIPGSELDQLNFETARHYWGMGGYAYREAFAIPELTLNFDAMLRTEFVNYSADFNARATWDDLYWAGVTYRTFDAVGLMAGINLNGVLVGYSYDITTNQLANVSWGSHEILVKYCHILPPPPITRSRNPRYL